MSVFTDWLSAIRGTSDLLAGRKKKDPTLPKPCPCCGSEAELETMCDYWYTVECVVCGVRTDMHPTEEEAMATWNKRREIHD